MRRFNLLLAALLTGCSPYVYEAEISKFGSAVTALDDATDSISNEIKSEPIRKAPWMFYQDKTSRVHLTPECAVTASDADCTLVQRGRRLDVVNNSSIEFADQTRAFVKILANYAKALQAVSSANDRADFDKAGSELTAALSSFGVPVNAVFEPAARLSRLAIGTSLDYQRLGQLRKSVSAVDKKLQEARPQLRTLLFALAGTHYASEYRRVREIERARNSARSHSERRFLTTELLSGVAELRQLRNTDAEKLADNLVDSHGLLAAALKLHSRGSTEIFNALNEFTQAAVQLRDAVQTNK